MLIAFVSLIALSSCKKETKVEEKQKGRQKPKTDLVTELGLETLGPIPYPPDNPPRLEKISLGRMLFFDPLLGGEKDVSCGTCHHPDFAFADFRQFGAGTSGKGLGPDRILGVSSFTGDPIELEPRNTPTIFNTAFNQDPSGMASHLGFQFLDGRVNGLEAQAVKPITSRVEMRGDAFPGTDDDAAEATIDSVINRLRAVAEYIQRFRAAFPEDTATKPGSSIIDSVNFGRALAAYERELVTRNSPYDKFVMGDEDALTKTQIEGLKLFFGKAKCGECHSGPMFSDYKFVVQGVPQVGVGKDSIPGDDLGRAEHTRNPADAYAFRTLTLRNIELTAPYMHDGVFNTLEEVVQFYNWGSRPRHPAVTDSMLHPILVDPLGLSDDEVTAVVEFMKALTDPGTALPAFLISVPAKVPSGLTPVVGN
jgi:cytochrome c peroxidase